MRGSSSRRKQKLTLKQHAVDEPELVSRFVSRWAKATGVEDGAEGDVDDVQCALFEYVLGLLGSMRERLGILKGVKDGW